MTLVVAASQDGAFGWDGVGCQTIKCVNLNRFQWTLNRWQLIATAINLKPDVVYVRDVFPLRIPRSETPIILEVQSRTSKELKLRSFTKFVLYSVLRFFMYRNVRASIFVTPELQHFNEIGMKNQEMMFSLGNGIDLTSVHQLDVPLPPPRLGVFFIGSSSQPWQGVAEIIQLARINSDLDFHIVGSDRRQSSPNNLFFHGELAMDRYWSIANLCTVALGTLNQTVTEMRQAVPLKVREYLALGLPVITRCDDPYIDEGAPYILKLPTDGSSISIHNELIRKFVFQWKFLRVSRSQIEYISVNEIEKKRLEIFEKVIRD